MRYEHLTVRGEQGLPRYDDGRIVTELRTDEDPPRVFASPDEVLRVLGADGWQCLHFHQDDGPQPQAIPMSLIQARPWPKTWVIRFQREIPE